MQTDERIYEEIKEIRFEKGILRRIDDLLIRLSVFFPILCWYWIITGFVAQKSGESFTVMPGLELGITILFLYFIELFIHHGVVRLFLTFLNMIASYLLFAHNISDRVVMFLFLIGILVATLVLWSKYQTITFLLPLAGGCFIGFAYVLSFGLSNVPTRGVLGIFVGNIICYYLHRYLNQYFWFLKTRQTANDEIPRKEILKAGISYTGLFTVISTIIFVILIKFQNIENFWLNYVKEFKVYDAKGVQMEPEEPIIQDVPNAILNQTTEVSATWVNFWNIVFYVLTIIAAVLLVIALFYGIRILISNISREKGRVDQEEILIRKNKYTDKEKKKQREIKDFPEKKWFLSPSQKIRRIYRTCIQKNLSETEPSLTAWELCLLFEEQKKEQAEEMTNLYEQARYQNDKCGKEDVERAKELLKKL